MMETQGKSYILETGINLEMYVPGTESQIPLWIKNILPMELYSE